MPDARAPRLKVDGVTASAEVLGRILDVRVDRRLNLTGSATVRCSGTQEGLPLKMGSQVEISSPAGDLAFAGVITAVELERYDAQHRVITFSLLDHSWPLRRRSRTVARLETKVSTVLSELAQEAGLASEVEATTTTYEYLLQNGNDLDYVDGLVAREAMDWWVAGKTFHAAPLSPVTGPARKIKAVELERLSVRASSVRPDRVVVRGWSTKHDAVSGQKDLKPSDLGADGTMADLVLRPADSGEQVHHTAALPVIDVAEANRLAEAALLRAASSAVRAELEGPGLWGIGPGDPIEVVDGEDASGRYLVTEVQHRFADGLATSRIISGDRRPPAIDGGAGAIDPSSALLHGIVVGVVTNLSDPDGKGRIKCRFPGLDDQEESDWARVSSISAGNGRGSSIRPEVNDEVLMAFEGGDLRKPVVLGSLFTSRTALPDFHLGNKGFDRTTVLHQFGHQFVMWGDDNKHGIEMKLKDGPSLLLDEKGITLKGGGRQTETLIEQGQSSIKLEQNGTITIKGVKIVVEASTDLELKGLNVKGTAQTNVTMTGNVGIELKGNATAKVQAGGALELKGGIVKIN